MPLVTAKEAQAFIRSDLSEAELQTVLDREEARLVAKLGPHGDGVTEQTVSLLGTGGDLYLPRAAVSVTSIAGTLWAALGSSILLDAGAGRISGAYWYDRVTVVYVPADDREARKQAIIDLARLSIQRTAMKAESTGGEYSYTAPQSWEAERAAIYRSLMYASL
jgi:hypothetical protein